MVAPLILGINAYHADAAACIVRDGVLVAAAEEERFRRIKHWAGFPSQAIRYCLREAEVDLGDVTHVAVNRSGRANFLRKLRYLASHRPNLYISLLKRLRNRNRSPASPNELAALAWPTVFRQDRLCRTPSGASRVSVLCLAVPRSCCRLGRWLRRFCQRGVGCRQRN